MMGKSVAPFSRRPPRGILYAMRPRFTWNLGARSLELGGRTLVMGVVNITPDSFSDGGLYLDPGRAAEHGLRLLEEGADILDLGGESTRPGARVGDTGVSEEEERRRVLPVLERLKRARPQAVLSVDTYKSGVARAAVAAGADIVNDVSGGRWDPQMPAAVAELGCGVVLMHMRGRPEEWRKLPPPEDIAGLVCAELGAWAQAALQAGVRRDRLVLDPGFGFGKNFAENYPLIAGMDALHQLGFPLLAGTSRKSFVGRTLARAGTDAPPSERLYGSLAAMVATILKGAHIVRVHEVKPAVEAAQVADAVLNAAS
jgi:dihydropteroate synthase